jgi:hypothetical protein
MATQTDAQTKAAAAAARARQVIAERITKLAANTESSEVATVILQLAQAYGHLAVEPPRTRGT